MALYNLLTCSGWEAKVGSYVGGSGCIKSRIGLVVLFFIIAVLRKWGGEEVGLDYNFLMGLILGLIPYIVVITIFGSFKIALVVGLLGGVLGGYFGGMLFGGSDDGY